MAWSRAAPILLLLAGALPAAAQAAPADAAPVQAWTWSEPWQEPDLAPVLDWLQGRGLAAHPLRHLGMVAFLADTASARALTDAVGGRVDPAESLPLHLDKSVPYIDADRVQQAVGPQRDGPTVLVVDTGVDSGHPDFQSGNLAANVQPSRTGGLITGTLDQAPVSDLAGHGTHVAGIVAGSGASLGQRDPLHERYRGVYSNGRVASYQVTLQEDADEEARVDTAASLQAFDWALENQGRYSLVAVTNSWGEAGDFDAGHPVHQATLRLYLNGMVVVFSAGNEGEEGPGRLNKYCLAPWVLCVAAGDLSGVRAPFSSTGHEGRLAKPYDHPDLSAPGSQIRAPNPLLGNGVEDLLDGLVAGEDVAERLYADRSGTSMAAPHVAAVAALLLAANPGLSPDQIMDVLVKSTRTMVEPAREAGAGYLDARLAYNLAVQTVGNREDFLRGREVKYAGPASGDRLYADDPLSVGYDSARQGSPLVLADRDQVWLMTPVAWVLLGCAAVAAGSGVTVRRREPS